MLINEKRNENEKCAILLELKDGTKKCLCVNNMKNFQENLNIALTISGYISENRVYVDKKRIVGVQHPTEL